MDEELGGVNPNSFFEQITEVRGVAETAQKTSNSNLNLLNELKEKVEVISNDLRLIKDKQFADEDRRQKKEMEAKVKEQNEKTKGAVVENKGESSGTKGGGGGIMGFVTSLVGGLVGGVTGLALQGIGGVIGLGAGVIDAGKKLGEKLKGLFVKDKDKKKKKEKNGGKVKTDKLMGVIEDEDEDEEKDKEKDSQYLKTVREKGKVVDGNVSQEKSDLMKKQIDLEEEMSLAIDQGDMKLYEELEKKSEEIDKKLFNLEKSPQSKKKKDKRGILGMIGGGIDAITGNLTDFDKRGGKTFGATRVATGMADFFTADMFDLDKRGKMDLFGMRKKMENKRKREAFENNPHVKNMKNQVKSLYDLKKGFPVDTTVNPDGSITSKFGGIIVGGEPVVGDTLSLKQRMFIKMKIDMGNKIEGIEKELYEKSGGGNFSEAENKEIQELYGQKEGERDPFDFYGDNNNSDDAFGFNQGGIVQAYNEGGEVDSVPAMLTPGEFVVTKDAVKKVGVDTLRGLNASVGATNKPTLMKGTTDSYLGEHSISFGGFNKGPIEKSMRMTDEGLEKTYFDGQTDIYELTGDNEYFREKTQMIGAGISSETIERYNIDETLADGARDILAGEVRRKSIGVSIGLPDLIEHKNQLMSEINKLEGFEKVTFEQFLKKEHGIPQELLLPILFRSDASKATGKKIDRAQKIDREQGVQPASAYMNPVILGYRQNQINPTRYTSFNEQIIERDQSSYKYDAAKDPTLVKGFNQGGLVTPIVESRSESGEMKLIKNLSQSVDSNRQTLMIMEKQNEVMNPPNQNPNPVALADTPQTAPAQLQETDAPIPFASLLRQSAQRYLNLSNNAMVIS